MYQEHSGRYGARWRNPTALVNVDGKAIEYDIRGNQITRGTTTIAYDSRDMPVRLDTPDRTIQNVYDGDGRRVERHELDHDDQSTVTVFFTPKCVLPDDSIALFALASLQLHTSCAS